MSYVRRTIERIFLCRAFLLWHFYSIILKNPEDCFNLIELWSSVFQMCHSSRWCQLKLSFENLQKHGYAAWIVSSMSMSLFRIWFQFLLAVLFWAFFPLLSLRFKFRASMHHACVEQELIRFHRSLFLQVFVLVMLLIWLSSIIGFHIYNNCLKVHFRVYSF